MSKEGYVQILKTIVLLFEFFFEAIDGIFPRNEVSRYHTYHLRLGTDGQYI